MRLLSRLLAGLTLLLLPVLLPTILLPSLASAQDFPAKPIKLIVPFPAGGPNDIIARVIGQRMSEIAKQPVLIVGHQPVIGETLGQLLRIEGGSVPVRKGAVWWLRSRERDGDAQTVLWAVQSAETV